MSSAFEAERSNPRLVAAIRERIANGGRITFREFMELALYHPRHGYYRVARRPMGRRGDYVTSPEVGPLFGAAIARQLQEMWDVMGRPHPFTVVEAGAGSGVLARDIIESARRAGPAFFDALRYGLVESSPSLRALGQQMLDELDLPDGKALWLETMPKEIVGCVLSNELIDAFPVHRVLVRNHRLNEVYVVWRDSAFVEEIGDPSTAEIAAYFERLGLFPGEGCYAEVNLEAPAWMGSVARALHRGFVLTFDYGYEAAELYAPWRRDGTLLCFYQQAPTADPYDRVGRQDLTASVDFTTLIRTGEEHGLITLGLVTQARFLYALGLRQESPATEAPAALDEYFARRRAIVELTDPAGLGRIRVLVQAKGIGRPRLAGLAGPAPA